MASDQVDQIQKNLKNLLSNLSGDGINSSANILREMILAGITAVKPRGTHIKWYYQCGAQGNVQEEQLDPLVYQCVIETLNRHLVTPVEKGVFTTPWLSKRQRGVKPKKLQYLDHQKPPTSLQKWRCLQPGLVGSWRRQGCRDGGDQSRHIHLPLAPTISEWNTAVVKLHSCTRVFVQKLVRNKFATTAKHQAAATTQDS